MNIFYKETDNSQFSDSLLFDEKEDFSNLDHTSLKVSILVYLLL